MKIGIFTLAFQREPLEKVLDRVTNLGVETVEIGSGGFIGKRHCDPSALLNDEGKLEDFRTLFQQKNVSISAFSCHGNVLHPQKNIADSRTQDLRETILLAEKMGVKHIVGYSGCPGGSDQDQSPNWIATARPEYFVEMLKWQWEEKVIPFWKEQGKFAENHGVKLCFEIHPGEVVYTPEKLLRLRKEVGEVVCCTLDPSHLFWQGMDPLRAIEDLGDAICHVHVKDTRIDPYITSRKGVLDTTPQEEIKERSWAFRAVGYGHDHIFWRNFVSQLRLVGYEGVLSIEHEDSLISPEEGWKKSVDFLREITMEKEPWDIVYHLYHGAD